MTTTGMSDRTRSLVEQRLRRGAAVIPTRPVEVEPPLSFAQERLWFMEQFAPGTAAYAVPVVIRLGSTVDEAALGQALAALVARHESLRMTFPTTPDGRPRLVIAPPGPVDLSIVDVPDADAVADALTAAGARPYDLAAGPLFRPTLVRAPGVHDLLLDLHHIVTDGWSTEVLLGDLLALYRGERDGRPADLAPLAVQYPDFAHWQRERVTRPAARSALGYWLDRLRGTPVLELPTDAPRPPVQTFDGAAHRFVLDATLVAGLERLGRERGATLFMTLLAAYQYLLARHSGQDDFAVASPVAGRTRPELEPLVGMFVNTLPLRAVIDPAATGAELIAATRQSVLDALANQEVPFEKVIDELGIARDVARPALCQVMFALQNYDMPDRGGDDAVSWKPVDLPATRFDLELHAYAAADGLACRLVYNTALFRPETVAGLAGHLTALLTDLVARPDVRLDRLSLLDPAERDLVTTGWNDTDAPTPTGVTLPALVLAQARRTPTATAVVAPEGELSYADLEAASAALAARLVAAGVTPGTPVAVGLPRGAPLVVALLAVLRAGGAYVPLDPDYPADRLRFMVSDAGAPVLVTDDPARLPDAGAVVVDPAGTGPAAPLSTVDTVVDDGYPAYVIYTSGSTGRPKGVVNAHHGIVNRLAWMAEAYAVGPDDVFLQKTPFSFDVSVWELFLPLITGARLVLARPGGHREPEYLRDLVETHGVTIVHFVPSMLAAFLGELDPGRCPSLRDVVCSGEELPVALVHRCAQRLPAARLSNLYGPTEAAVDVTAWPCDSADLGDRARVPIGRPIHNTRTYVLDAELRPVGVGVPGELYLGGRQVARGYHGRPGLTAARFVPDPYADTPGARLYRTGDRARWRPDGTLEYLGRLDHQVKLRGLRIELGEIEAALRDQPHVLDAAVVVHEGQHLVAYVVGGADPEALRTALKQRLPDYMVPTAFTPLDALPLGASGKLDRAALPAPRFTATGEHVEPRDDTERAVADIWTAVLGLATGPGIDDDFFALGGHSLLATQVVARMRTLTEGSGRQVGVMDLFQHPTVRGLAALVGSADVDRPLLYELTRHVTRPVLTYVCVPYGGGSAVVYQPMADRLPTGHKLLAVAIPGHDVGLDEDALPFEELAARCAAEILSTVEGPLVLYGHCGVGGALAVELARRIEAAGRDLDAVYIGGMFPFARPRGLLTRLQSWVDDRASNRTHAAWLTSMGVDMEGIDAAQADRIIHNMRRDGRNAEEHFTALLDAHPARLNAPIISVVGEKDPVTDYYEERYREWGFITDTSALVVLDEAGHFFLRYRADELVEIITTVHPALLAGTALPARAPGSGWAADAVSRVEPGPEPTGTDRSAPEPSMGRFLTVAVGQLVSLAGSALTQWAVPVWVYVTTGSLMWFGLSGVLAFVPGLIALPIAGGVTDRSDRRRIILLAGAAAGGLELVMALLLWTDSLSLGFVYPLIGLIGFAATFQRIAFTAAVPQLVPKRYLGHANGVVQLMNGLATLFVPLLAAGVLALVGLGGILTLDLVSYVIAGAILLAVRFPSLMGRRRRETFLAELAGGARLIWANRHFRTMLLYFSAGNLLLATPMLMVTPLVLAFATMREVGQISFAEGMGAAVGGLAVALWGGPRRHRMATIIATTGVVGLFCVLTGLRPSLLVVAAGVFGTAAGLAVANGIYLTIIQVKVPQRFHGRVIALNQTVTWSTFPIGFALLAPLTGTVLEPLLRPGGALAGSVGAVIGTGPGRGIGFGYVVFGVALALVALLGFGLRGLTGVERDLPDALPDDLVGAQALAARRGTDGDDARGNPG